MHMHRSMCTFVMYTMHCRTFCIRFECDKCLNVSFDLFARCVNNGIKERIVQLTTEWATVFAESKERIFNQVHKKWDSVEQFETLSDMFSVHIPHCKGNDTLWLCKRCCLFSLRTHKKKRIELKMGNVERNLERITSTLIYEQRLFTLIPQIDSMSICRCVSVCFCCSFFSFTLRSVLYPFVAEFVFDFMVKKGQKGENIYLWGGKYMLSMNKSNFMSILCQNLLHCIIMSGVIFFCAKRTN